MGTHPHFDMTLVKVLREAGIPISADHGAIPHLRAAFQSAWHEVARLEDQFRHGNFSNAPDTFEPPAAANATVEARQVHGGVDLDQLLREYLSERPRSAKEVGEAKTYVRRLKERIGEISVRQIGKPQIAQFKGDLRRFPKRLKKRHNEMTFDEILADVGDDPAVPRLQPKTQKKWFDIFASVFALGVAHGHLDVNPISGLKPKITKQASPSRLRYDEEDVAQIFSSPMFTGCTRVYNSKGRPYGYRETPGTLIVRDAYYWLPLMALWMGFRLEEAGAARVGDVKTERGIVYLDLEDRQVKSKASRRQVPLHPKLIALGFLDYVSRLKQSKEMYLFPNLPHADGKAATRQFTKWWGLWCRANARARGMEGQGFDDPRKTFHSLRHAFKRQCRGVMDEEMHDLLTGHSSPAVGRSYGRGADLAALADAIAKVDYPSFPNVR
jgi:integrase